MSRLKMPDGETAEMFRESMPEIAAEVVSRYKRDPEARRLLGNNPLEMVEYAQRYFGLTLLTFYSFGDAAPFIDLMPWDIRNYRARGFRPEYFPFTMQRWDEAICARFPDLDTAVFTDLLRWLTRHFSYFESKADIVPPSYIDGPRIEGSPHFEQAKLLELFLTRQHEQAREYIEEVFADRGIGLYVHVLQPVMYEIGRLWELGRVTVLEEHEITAVLAEFLEAKIVEGLKTGRYAVKPSPSILITPAPNEFHELGALMVADTFRRAGWKVSYLQADATDRDLLNEIDNRKPDVLGISIAIILHAAKLKTMVGEVRERYPGLPILAGGKFIRDNPKVTEHLNVDGYALDADDAVEIASRLVSEAPKKESSDGK